MTRGETVLPESMLTPEVVALLQRTAREQGLDPASFQVGSGRNSINPRTGQIEFADVQPTANQPSYTDKDGNPVEGITATPLGPVYFPTPGNVIRSGDLRGDGGFGASRRGGATTPANGRRSHEGIDLAVTPGQQIVSPVSGVVTSTSGNAYKGDDHYKIVQIRTPNGYTSRVMYVDPSIRPGTEVQGGVTPIGTAQDLEPKYPGIINHTHLEVRDPSYKPIDPTDILRRYIPYDADQ